ncbi:unnamed protein product [Paramecium octaurelia]|uniref:Uncharacterized protein n=1 Tax=Paramecium octaurelia TaxID=43137 RepID=A0A8S1S2Y3_PAROT|nr:unnamed protein product [Paramecium octaurelia]
MIQFTQKQKQYHLGIRKCQLITQQLISNMFDDQRIQSYWFAQLKRVGQQFLFLYKKIKQYLKKESTQQIMYVIFLK